MGPFLIWSNTLFISGIIGMFLTRKHILILIISLELIMLGINVTFIIYALAQGDIYGKLLSFIILTTAAAEAALGLAILVSYYKINGGVSIRSLNLLKG